MKNIAPSARFVERLVNSDTVSFVRPADQAWCWIGFVVPSNVELRYPCACAAHAPPTWSVADWPTTEAPSYTVVRLRIVRYMPRRLIHQYFWVGQCSRCSKVYWGLARRRPRVHRPADYENWKRRRVRAEMWHCGDDVCDCWQPVIQRYEPNRRAGYPWLNINRLWEGTFCSGPDDKEREGMWDELKAASSTYEVESCVIPY